MAFAYVPNVSHYPTMMTEGATISIGSDRVHIMIRTMIGNQQALVTLASEDNFISNNLKDEIWKSDGTLPFKMFNIFIELHITRLLFNEGDRINFNLLV